MEHDHCLPEADFQRQDPGTPAGGTGFLRIIWKGCASKAKGIRQGISALSGGNQQKVMLARWMMMGGDVFLLEEPTRGIDVNAKTEVYEAIGECVKSGKGVVIVSSEEEEVLGICDKILVMKQGRVIRVMDAKSATTEEIKHYSV
ncbi:MAG: ATP-binding cassette domain-containing protein [Enterocloster bolteae]